MLIEKYRHPVLFYALCTAIPWALWFAAAYVSHLEPANESREVVASLLGVAGLFAPAVVAFCLIWPDPDLRSDVKSRTLNFTAVRPVYLFLTCFLMLVSILLAQTISLFFGYSADQFALRTTSSFAAGIFPGWFMLFLAPPAEELAWHSYGTDCLRSRMNLVNTSLLFGVYWALWHLPLAFIKGYYHSNVAAEGLIYSLNFAFSIIPFVLILNWLYYKTGRNILIAIIFHVTAGYFNELFSTHPDSKIIQTALLTVLSAALVLTNRRFFLSREYRVGKGGQAQ